ncbi:hypothetical protein [Hymenobacter sp. YC55]|uniref:hypothetical protein n=1 Tax=Hymenobacter sp. YC55 TaxID=3034019 RepID=UPI0023F759AB|nr:hypothetical protein [Hymenobacter sp. YC55]MDF7813900.1 hypothetical protein [Hymenobacter sp. YC55]
MAGTLSPLFIGKTVMIMGNNRIRHQTMLLAALLWLLVPRLSRAQHILRGTVRDVTGTALPAATAAVPALGLGTATTTDRRYQLTLPAGPQQVTMSFVSYVPQTFPWNPSLGPQPDATLAANTSGCAEC